MYHNIETCLHWRKRNANRGYPYRGYTSRVGLDHIFLIKRTENGRRWGAWGLNEAGDLAGSYLHATTLRELSVLLGQIR